MTAVLHRPLRVAGLLKREITLLLRNKINDPRLNRLTVTDVEVSKGCSHAKVYISVSEDEDKQRILQAVKRAGGYIRNNLSSNLELKFVPKLSFKIDDSYEQGERIENLLGGLSDMPHCKR